MPPVHRALVNTVNTRGYHRHDSRAYDRLMCSLYYPLHGGRAAQIKGCRVDNAVRLDGRKWRCAWQPEVQSKVDILGGPPLTATEAVVQAEHRLNLARSLETDRENGYENRSPVFSYERSPTRFSHKGCSLCLCRCYRPLHVGSGGSDQRELPTLHQ